jgi:hypothetical protein
MRWFLFVAAILVSPLADATSRFLIQSIVERRGGVTLSEYLKQHSDKCKPALILFNPKTVHVPSLSDPLKNIQDDYKQDLVRHAFQMKKVWDSSIMSELGAILKAIRAQEAKVGKDMEHVLEASLKPKGNIFPTKDGKFAMTEEQHKLVNMDSQALRVDTWNDYEKKLNLAKTGLKDTGDSLQALLTEFENIFEKHIGFTKAGDWYKLNPNEFVAETFAAPKENEPLPASKYSYSFDPKAEKDTFNDVAASELGSEISRLIAVTTDAGHTDEFENFLKRPGSPIEEIDRMTSTLSTLSMRMHGIQESKKSLQNLMHLILMEIYNLREKAYDKFTPMWEKLNNVIKLTLEVFGQAEHIHGVTIDRSLADDATTGIDAQIKTLNGFMGKDEHGAKNAYLNLVANSAWKLNAYLWAFVESYSNPNFAGAQSGIILFTRIIPELLKNGMQALEDPKTAESLLSSIAEFHRQKSRQGAECLLYGKIDALMIRAQGPKSEKEACGYLHDAALACMDIITGKEKATVPDDNKQKAAMKLLRIALERRRKVNAEKKEHA